MPIFGRPESSPCPTTGFFGWGTRPGIAFPAQAMADQEAAAPRGANPSVASLPEVESVPRVEGVPGVVSDIQGAQTICAQSGTGAGDEWQPSDFRFVHAVDDDVMSTGSRATLAIFTIERQQLLPL